MEESLEKNLFMKKENGWETVDESKKEEIFKFSNGYMNFLNKAKTEREFIQETIKLARENGYKDIMEFQKLQSGDKIYFINREKSMYLAIIGTESIESGLHIIGSHVDSPRLDLKPNPLYEDTDMAYLKTHYYGGIKKYQWTTIPLSLHGVIVKSNGEKITVNIGEDDNDPIFTITDLLPHLAKEHIKQCHYIVTPIYQDRNQYDISLDSIIRIKIVHIIYSMLNIVKKGRKKHERTSNRRAYAYRYE